MADDHLHPLILIGFLYLAVIFKICCSRKVIGWALSKSIDTEMTLHGSADGFSGLEGRPGVVSSHSDRGVQYAAHAYVEELRAAGILISMARKGNPYDNATAESFMKTLKHEEVYLWEYKDGAGCEAKGSLLSGGSL